MAMLRNEKDVAGEGFLEDTYLLWCEQEGPPVHEDFCVDLFEVETKLWPRYGCNAAFVHLKGRGDFMSVFLLEHLSLHDWNRFPLIDLNLQLHGKNAVLQI